MSVLPAVAPDARPRAARSAAVLAAVVALVATLFAVPTAARADTVSGVPAGRYYPVTPTRVYDTGNPGMTAFGPNDNRTIDLSKAFTAPASAVVINLTAAFGSADSVQTVYPTGTTRPGTSNLNELRGSVRANSVTVAVGQGGTNQNKIDLWNAFGNVRLVVDVTGYYGKGGTVSDPGSTYVPLQAPVRLFDTRSPQSDGPLGNVYPNNTGIATVDYGSPAINKTIRAVAMNMTVTSPAGPGFLTLWNGSGAAPTTSSINFVQGQTVANLAIVPVRCYDDACSSVTFTVLNMQSSTTQVIGDIQGMYATPGSGGGTVFSAITPTRVLDTRTSSPWAALGATKAGVVPAGSWGASARAVAVNVTAVLPQVPTFLTVSAVGNPPSTSSLNAVPGDIVPNAVQSRMTTSGFQVYNNAGGVNVVADVLGVFLPDPGTVSGSAAKADAATTTAALRPAGGFVRH